MFGVINQVCNLFKAADFEYAICGGFALDMFVGKELRNHGDVDIVVYNEDKHRILKLLADGGWLAFGRFMEEGKPITQQLFYKINDITDNYWDSCKNMWVIRPKHLPNVLERIDRLQEEVYTYKPRKWLVQEEIEFIELEFDSRENGTFILQEAPKIIREMEKAILYRNNIPYLAPEIVLFYKTDRFSHEHPVIKVKTIGDFNTIMPLLSDESRKWLAEAVKTAYPDGYPWCEALLSDETNKH